jgi:adenine-specific DNA-methyltransferase
MRSVGVSELDSSPNWQDPLAPNPTTDAEADASSAITPSGRYINLNADKLRGGYYTSQALSDWLAKWAVRSPLDTILEPSCGNGNILMAGAKRLLELGANASQTANQIQGVELSSREASTARSRIIEMLGEVRPEVVQADDFFGWREREVEASNFSQYSAVIGNPPFIRYQAFPEPARSRAMEMMGKVGLKPNKLTNIWVPFIVAATEALRPGGRLALVVPAELLQVTYAGQLRRFLTQRFRHVGLISCNELFFEGAEQEVLLLLAEGALPATSADNDCRVALVETATVEEVVSSDPIQLLSSADEKHVCGDSEKWLKYFLSSKEIDFMRDVRRSKQSCSLSHYASVDVGVVTGKNQFFVLRKSETEINGLKDCVVRLVSRSAHLKGAIFHPEDWDRLSVADERVHLMNLRQEGGRSLTPVEARYVRWGEEQGFNLGYKCRIRKPWFHIPAAWIPDCFLFRQIYDFPRLVQNKASATATDTLHRVAVRGCAPEQLIASTYTYLTAASAEIEGRSYGGGVLELEPTEAERLLIPIEVNRALALEETDQLLKARGIEAVLAANERRVLMDAMGLTRAEIATVKGIWEKLRDRRRSRGRSRKVS